MRRSQDEKLPHKEIKTLNHNVQSFRLEKGYHHPKEKKPKEKKEKKPKDEEKKKKKKKKKKKVSDIVALVRMLLNVLVALLKRLGRNFKIRVYAYEICVAFEEAAKTAVMYGAVKSLSETIFLRLQDSINFKIVKQKTLQVELSA